MRSALLCLTSLSLIVSGAAWAQEAIPTAANAGSGAPPAPPASARPTMIADRDSERDDRGPVPIGPCGKPYKDDGKGGLKQDKNPAGEAWAGVGTHGYREVGGVVCIPAGRNSAVSIAIDDTRWGRR